MFHVIPQENGVEIIEGQRAKPGPSFVLADS